MRRSLAVLLALVGCLLGIVSLVAVWAREEVLDTDRYVASVRPLAADPVIQGEVADRVAQALLRRLDVGSLPAPAQLLVRQAIRQQTATFMDSAAFQALWVQTNRSLHRQLVLVLRDGSGGAVAVRSGELQLDLTGVADAVRAQVAAVAPAGLGPLPRVRLVVDVADASQVRQARTAVVWLDRLALVLPVITLALLGSALLMSRRRLRAAGLILVVLAAVMASIRLLLVVGLSAAQARLSDRVASDAAVAAFYDHVTALLRDAATGIGVGAFLVGLVALAGSLVVGRQNSRTSNGVG